MLTNTLISKVLEMTPQGVGKWRKENRPIINLLEKYFSKEDLEEFLNTSQIYSKDILRTIEFNLIRDIINVLDTFTDFYNEYKEEKFIFFLSSMFTNIDFKTTTLIKQYITSWQEFISYEEFEEIIDFLEYSKLLINHKETISYITSKSDYSLFIKSSTFSMNKNLNTSLLIYIFLNCKEELTLDKAIKESISIFNKYKFIPKDKKVKNDKLIDKYFFIESDLAEEFEKLSVK